MRSRLLTIALAVIAALTALPVSAQQYVTPEQALQEGQTYLMVNTGPRATHQLLQQQDQAAVARHQSNLKDYPVDAASSSSESSASSMAGTLKPSAPQTQLTLDPVTERLLKRIELRGQQNLHSGAPLAGSGPEGYATVVVMLGAVAWTLRRAKKLEKIRW